MSRKKSVSLFEALPPRNNDRSPKASSAEKAAPAKSNVRKSVDVATLSKPKAKATPETTEKSTALHTAETSTTSHQVSGISAAKKDDHFYAIAFCTIAFSTITFVAGYSLGSSDASSKRTTTQVSHTTTQSTQTQMAAAPRTEATRVKKKTLDLPTSLQHLTKEQTKRVAPPTPPRNYTLQIETLRGQNQQRAINNLVSKLQSLGHDAFANKNNGAVYVGRLESSMSAEAKRLKQSIVKLNRGSYADAFFIRIPSHLLENP